MGNAEELEALLALRQVTSTGVVPGLDESGAYELGDKRYSGDMKTCLVSSEKNMTLRELVLAFELADQKVGSYVMAAINLKLARLHPSDRDAVLDFLRGSQDWIPQIHADRESATGDSGNKGTEVQREAPEPSSGDGKRDQQSNTYTEGVDKSHDEVDTATPEDMLLRKIKKREGCHRNRNSILQSAHRFTDALRIDWEARKKSKDATNGYGVNQNYSGATPGNKTNTIEGAPIIVVPPLATAPISLLNIRSFLEDGQYVPGSQLRAESSEKEEAVYIERKFSDGTFIRFKVVDSVRKFQNPHWERLTAVFTLGPQWQFKGWRWKDTATVFEKCRGLHVYFDDKKLDDHIKTWNVVKFPLSKQTRSLDRTLSYKIWQAIESFMRSKKPELLQAGARAAELQAR